MTTLVDPMTAWIPLLSGAIGVTLGALLSIVAGWLQFTREKRHEARALKLKKLEELYEVLTSIGYRYRAIHGVQADRLNLPPELQNDDTETSPIPFHRMQMIVDIYAPSLQSYVDAILKAREACGLSVVEGIFARDKQKTEKDQIWEEACKVHEKMEAAVADARDATAQLARSLAA